MYSHVYTVHEQESVCFPFLLVFPVAERSHWKYMCFQSTYFSLLKLKHIVFTEIEVME